jgi:4'-phosphopantetheinyl transferase
MIEPGKYLINWVVPSPFPVLRENEIHIWLVDLNTAVRGLPFFTTLLSSEERSRAEKFKFANLYQNFVITRGLLRKILSKYLGKNPHGLAIKYSPSGKPFIETSVHFNISHSNNLALLAFCAGNELGIDIEYKRQINNIEELCLKFFSKQETEEILSADFQLKVEKFYNFWVKKESYTKAIGGKIFDVLNMLRNYNLHIGKDFQFCIEPLLLNDAYAAAFAIKTKPAVVRYWLVGPDIYQ